MRTLLIIAVATLLLIGAMAITPRYVGGTSQSRPCDLPFPCVYQYR